MNRIPELIKELEELASHNLEIGIIGKKAGAPHGESGTPMGVIAAAHEFGATIKREGNNATHLITIPERSYIRAGWDSKEGDITKHIEYQVDRVLTGHSTADACYTGLGNRIADYLREYLMALSSPPLKPSTIASKGSSQVLVDTGQLGSSIDWEVV